LFFLFFDPSIHRQRMNPHTRSISTAGRALPVQPPTQELESINKKDDIEAAVKWMAKGRVDTKGFSEVLPHTSQDLRDGKVTPDQVANDLKGVYTRSTGSIRLEGVEIDPIVELSYHTTMAALSPNFFHISPCKQDEICVAFSNDIMHKFRERKFLGIASITLCLKACVDQVCEQWADRLDAELFRGKKGMFL
jgi:hypothetical protein